MMRLIRIGRRTAVCVQSARTNLRPVLSPSGLVELGLKAKIK
ncbi:hypothetical protein [Bradyrhizobium sp. AZCC 2289]